MHDAGILVPITLFISLAAMIFGIVYMNKRENLAMIEKGLNPKEYANRPVPYKNLKWGLLLTGAGIGLLIAFILSEYVLIPRMNKYGEYHDDDATAFLYFALIAIGGGLGLIISYRIEKKELLDKNGRNG
jgi:hypothetical protein